MKIKVNKKKNYTILNAEIVNACTYKQYNPQFFFGLTYGPSHNGAIKKPQGHQRARSLFTIQKSA